MLTVQDKCTFVYIVMLLMLHTYKEKSVRGNCFAMEENVLTRASCLGHTDTNIHLLHTYAAAKLSHVKGKMAPANQMWQGLPWEANPVMLLCHPCH